MKRQPRLLPIIALFLGIVGAGLRLLQLGIGFDPISGLAVTGSWINAATPAFLIGCIALFVLLSLPHKGSALSFDSCFSIPEGLSLMLLIMASFLLMAGGGLYLVTYLQTEPRLTYLAAGVIGLFAGMALLYAVRCWRQDGTVSGPLLLSPVLLFLFHLLAAYLSHGTFPVTARYGIEILGFSALLYGAYQISAAGYRQGRRAALLRGTALGIALSIPAAVDLLSFGESTTLLAGTLMLLGFGLTISAEE